MNSSALPSFSAGVDASASAALIVVWKCWVVSPLMALPSSVMVAPWSRQEVEQRGGVAHPSAEVADVGVSVRGQLHPGLGLVSAEERRQEAGVDVDDVAIDDHLDGAVAEVAHSGRSPRLPAADARPGSRSCRSRGSSRSLARSKAPDRVIVRPPGASSVAGIASLSSYRPLSTSRRAIRGRLRRGTGASLRPRRR